MAFVFEDDQKATAPAAGADGGRFVFEDDEPAGPVIRQGKDPSLIDRVFDLFENPDKERAKAVQALVDAEVFNIRPSDAMRYRAAIDEGVKLNKNAIAASRRTGVMDRIGQSWDIGVKQVQVGLYGSDVVMNNNAESFKTMQEIQSTMPGEDEIFIPESKLENAFSSAAKMSPMMFQVMKESVKKGIPAAMGVGGAVALLGQAGPQALLPEEAVTVPVGAAIGFKAGATGAAFTEALKLESGLAFSEFLMLKDDQGNQIDPNIARAAAFGVGAINAGLEVAQIKTLLKTVPGLDKLVGKAVMEAVTSKALKDRLASVATMYAGTVAKETAQELAQESTNIVMEHVAANVNNAIKGTDIKASDMEAILDRLFATGKESAAAFSVMALPGASLRLLPPRKKQAGGNVPDASPRADQGAGKGVVDAQPEKGFPVILGVNEDANGEVKSFTMADPVSGETFEVAALRTEDKDTLRLIPDMEAVSREIESLRETEIDANLDQQINDLIESDTDIDQVARELFGEQLDDFANVSAAADEIEAPRWVRGERQENQAGDLFFSSSADVASNYGDVREITDAERPKNTLVVSGKPELAERIGYNGDPLAESLDLPKEQKFDYLAKQYAQSKDYDSIQYESGTFDEPELVVFKGANKRNAIDLVPDFIDEAKPETILSRVKAINDSIGEKGSIDFEPLVDLGRSIWSEGHTTIEAFTARAKELLSDVWDKVQYHIQAAWEILNNERGSVNIEGVTTPKGTANIPAKTTPQAEAGNPFKDSVVQELVYHGTKSKPFDKFNTEGGAFFTTDRTGAISYTQNRQSQMSGNKSPQGKARVIDAYVDVRKPLDLTAYGSEEPILSPVSSYLGHQKNHAEKLRILLGNPSDNQILTAMKGMVINDKLLENLYHNDPMIYVLQEIFNARQAKYFGNNANAQSFLSAYKYKVKNGQEIFQERIDSDVKKLLEGLGYDSVIFNDTAVGGLGNQKSIKSIAVFNSDQIHQLPNPSRPPEVGGQSTLYSGVDPTQIIPVLKSLTNNIQEAMPHLEALGLKAYESGKSTYSAWSAEMKSYLGDLWESFKGIMATLWESVKTLWESVKAFNESLGERGSVSWKKKPTTEEINMMLSAAARQDQATGGNLAPESYLDLQAQAAQEAFAVIEKKMTRTQKREAAMLARQGEADARLMPVYSAMSHIVNAGGMSLKSLQADYDGNTIRELMNKRPGLVSNKGTMGPDVFADQHGFESGDDMINAILDWRGLKAEGKAQAKEFLKYYEKVIATDDMAAMREEFERAEQKALDRLTKKYQPKSDKGIKREIRQRTGQTRAGDRFVTEYDALTEAFRKEANTARRAFSEGKKEEVERSKEAMRWLVKRRKSLQNVRDYFNLTDAEMMSATNRRNPALMDDAEFKQFLRNVELKAVELAETRQEKMALLKLIEDKRLKKVDNYRRALELPTFNDMTAQQLRDFAKLLEPFQDDDIFLTQRELETVDRTDLKGIKTWREARERLAKEAGVPVEELNKVHVEALDSFRWDTSLRERDPFFGILVEQMTQSYLGAQLRAHEIENRVYELARKSEKSRDRGIIDRMIPQDDLIMAFLEAPMDQRAAIVEQMTPEQIDFANYMQQYFAGALEYLIATKSIERGRENYFVHIRKTFLENLKDGGLKKAVSEIFKTYQQDQMVFNILDDDTGKILPLEKFFQFSLQRTDTMDPTRNVTKAFLTYVNTFEKKKMYDAIIPKLDIYAQALTPTRYTPRGLEIDRSLKTFVNKWINNKKGRRISFDSTLRQGGPLDVGIRALRAFTTILDLGLSPVVQTAAFLGEQVTNAAMLGNKAMAIGTARMRTAQGKAILKKYESWVGRSLWEEFTVPGKEITERLSHALFAGFRLSSVSANKQFLLASLTEQEWATGEISTERLAEMRLDLGRFRVVPGTGSLVGSTSVGDAVLQYKKWAAPFARTLAMDAQKFLGDLKSKPIGEALTSREARELYRLAYLSMAVFVVGAMAGADDDDKSVMGKAKARMYREAMTLMQGVDPTLWLASPRLLTWLYQTASALKSVALMETYKSGDKEGELKGPDEMKRQFVPGVVRSLSNEENKR